MKDNVIRLSHIHGGPHKPPIQTRTIANWTLVTYKGVSPSFGMSILLKKISLLPVKVFFQSNLPLRCEQSLNERENSSGLYLHTDYLSFLMQHDINGTVCSPLSCFTKMEAS
ncbi:hypothetical protein GDO81_020181 [Engystomops pustulosus]|uniref:Uncharacterized protein n=1 Tax=Engystomops pustulosus TaxID=76066 RepID=A0AAV6YY52_ENGPU|nr:hypothetical protein GDO81_020181 [Engystomops pustulosus]